MRWPRREAVYKRKKRAPSMTGLSLLVTYLLTRRSLSGYAQMRGLHSARGCRHRMIVRSSSVCVASGASPERPLASLPTLHSGEESAGVPTDSRSHHVRGLREHGGVEGQIRRLDWGLERESGFPPPVSLPTCSQRIACDDRTCPPGVRMHNSH